ncbi:MAG: hypothetical protein K8U57_38080 [Planctomycetes bacterium]|nr:hypothetical protein [Planctomycetota bacterium]
MTSASCLTRTPSESGSLPSQFECVACGLKISNYAQLAVCGLGEPYTSTWVYDAAEYYADAMREYEDDNNENF